MYNKISFKNQIIALLIFTSFALSISSCKKDSLEETSLDVPQTSALPDGIQSEVVAADGVTTTSYYLVNALPVGYVQDGSKDYTSYVQAAVNKNTNIVFPGFPILVNDAGINIGSNKTITFSEGSEIRLKGTSKESYNILNLSNVSNVTLYNPVITGDRNSHIGTSGEYGMGIGIRGSTNITINNAKITNCWGDGIYIGQTNGTVNCKNIVLKDIYLRKNRRDGLTVIAVDGLLINNIYAGYTDGTKPWCGINIETNNTSCELKNIVINNPVTESNGSRGIQIVNRNMLGTVNKFTDITIVNHVDRGAPKNAFKLSCMPTIDISAKMNGSVNLINPTWIKSSTTDYPMDISTNQPNYKVNISSPEITFMSGKVLTYPETYTHLMKQASRAPLTVTNPEDLIVVDPIVVVEPVVIVTPPVSITPSIPVIPVVFAVNAGGSSFTSSEGITYASDRNYTKGSIYKTTTAISNTVDDALYQSERYGNFSYAIPLIAGTYEITFKMSEVYHTATGKRQFDILAEGVLISSNLDIFSLAGSNKAYDLVKTVTVSDGNLNLNFITDVDNAKVSAFHIIKK